MNRPRTRSTRQQHHPSSTRQQRRPSRLPHIGGGRSVPPLIAIAIIGLATIGIILGINYARQGTGSPKVGDHWHSIYQASICGKDVPDLPSTSVALGIHTHGDGLIHSEPGTIAQTGKNNDLDHFFKSTGGSVQFSSTHLKWGNQDWSNGTPCPTDGRPGKVKFFVNGLPNDRFERYVPQRGDIIRIEFSAD